MVTMELTPNLENRLMSALGAARRTLSKIEGRCQQRPGRRGNTADQANHVVDLATNMALRESHAKKVSQIERAVARSLSLIHI